MKPLTLASEAVIEFYREWDGLTDWQEEELRKLLANVEAVAATQPTPDERQAASVTVAMLRKAWIADMADGRDDQWATDFWFQCVGVDNDDLREWEGRRFDLIVAAARKDAYRP